MEPIDSFNDNLGTAIALCGNAGSGKTSLGMRLFPNTYVLVADLNFRSGKDYLARTGQLSNVLGFDYAGIKDGKTLPANARYAHMFKCLCDAIANPKVGAILLDSATFIEDIIKAKICGAVNDDAIRLEGFAQWGLVFATWKSLIMQMRQSGKKIIMTVHETKEQDKFDNIFKYALALDGQIAQKFPAFFSDVLRCEVEVKGTAPVYSLRTISNTRQEYLKNSYNLPVTLTQDEAVRLIRERK